MAFNDLEMEGSDCDLAGYFIKLFTGGAGKPLMMETSPRSVRKLLAYIWSKRMPSVDKVSRLTATLGNPPTLSISLLEKLSNTIKSISGRELFKTATVESDVVLIIDDVRESASSADIKRYMLPKSD